MAEIRSSADVRKSAEKAKKQLATEAELKRRSNREARPGKGKDHFKKHDQDRAGVTYDRETDAPVGYGGKPAEIDGKANSQAVFAILDAVNEPAAESADDEALALETTAPAPPPAITQTAPMAAKLSEVTYKATARGYGGAPGELSTADVSKVLPYYYRGVKFLADNGVSPKSPMACRVSLCKELTSCDTKGANPGDRLQEMAGQSTCVRGFQKDRQVMTR